MIGFLKGRVAGRAPDGCFLDVNGVGYRLACSATTLASLPADGEPCRLWTHVHVREDALALYGFASGAEQRMFEALLSVSGVGPKVALQVCSSFGPESFRRTLVAGDSESLSAVPGIGKKTAQRIVLDLKERLDLPDLEVVDGAPDTLSRARSALENLGYNSGEVRVALSETRSDSNDSVEDLVRKALKAMA